MKNWIKKIGNLIIGLLFTCNLFAQVCPMNVVCGNAGNTETTYVMVFYWSADTGNMADMITFIYDGETYSNITPTQEWANYQLYSIPVSGSPICPDGGTGFIDNILLILDGNTDYPCEYIDSELVTFYGNDLECPISIECDGSFPYMVFNSDEWPGAPGVAHNATFYFDHYPCMNGTYDYSSVNGVIGFRYVYYNFLRNLNGYPNTCNQDDFDFTVVFSDPAGEYERICVFEDGIYCPPSPTCEPNFSGGLNCEEFIGECGDEIVRYAEDYFESGDNGGCRQWGNSCSPDALIKRMGNVAIGTERVPSGFKMAVKSRIFTEQFFVKTNGWCDYVFEEDYVLLPLKDVEKYISVNGHLPNFPSAACIEEDGGFDVGEMAFKQQEKIEAAFLHLIDLDQRLEAIDSLLVKK